MPLATPNASHPAAPARAHRPLRAPARARIAALAPGALAIGCLLLAPAAALGAEGGPSPSQNTPVPATAQPTTVPPTATATTPTPTVTAAPPAATATSGTAPATSTPSTGTAPAQPTGTTVTVTRTPAKKSSGLSTAALVLAAAGLLILLCAAVWAIARMLALEPRWSRSLRHSLDEAGYRASATLAELGDWMRLGR